MSETLKFERRAKAIADRDSIIMAAYRNEELTRRRVDILEQWTEAWRTMPLRKRLKWLILGS